jgi:hypothetical protein
MDSLNFENIFNKENGNVGDLFQSFVFELLRKSDFPKLHKFQTAGRDGGIDLIQQLKNERTVVECKYIGDNSIEEAENRWKKVKKHFETHLVTSPPKEKQYKPWLNSDTPIISYLFCVSSEIRNQAGFDEFEKDITNCFNNLANSYPHLKHLENIRVEIIDRNKLLEKLDDFPQLKFKWFPQPEKYGFIPIHKKSNKASFRSFLEEESLPFYNRSKHLEKHPNANIQSEEQLLETLENKHGLIITGSGGSGKTRLTLELGRLAYEKGWLVFRCNETVNVENLNELIRITADNSKVLLLMDYVETQKHFTEIIENLEVINDYYNFQIKYVANCRTSFYPTIRDIIDYHPVSLTSSHTFQSSDIRWLKQYQESVVRHILEKGGIEIDDKHLSVCKNSPILAVFLLYLHRKNRDEELENLLREEDFGKWIQKRTRMSFVNVTDFEIKLAKLTAIFPFSEDVWNRLDDFNVKLLNILANDSWIEKFQESEWRSIHDVFADQIMLSYVRDNPHFIERFVRDIFSFSYSTDCLNSAMVSVQRLSPYLEVDFNKILNAEIDRELSQWKKIRNYLLETSLLQETNKLDLLSKETLWEDAEKDVTFQTGFGTIIRRMVHNSDSLTDTQLLNAKTWLDKSLPFISSNNFLLVWALRFSPEHIKGLALDRMRLYSSDFHTYRIFRAWLDTDLPISTIREYVQLWLGKHQTDYEASFVYQAWLEAGGDTDVIKDNLKQWLAEHQTDIKASFVYQAWLGAGGDTELVYEPIGKWLLEHGMTHHAKYVYIACFDTNINLDYIKELAINWLQKHKDIPPANPLIKRLIKHLELPIETIQYILLWCYKFKEDEGAVDILASLEKEVFDYQISDEFLVAAEGVIEYLLLKGNLNDETKEQIIKIFFNLFSNSALQDYDSVERIDKLFVKWLKYHDPFGEIQITIINYQKSVYLERLALMLEKKILDVSTDRLSIERFLRHFNNWLPENKKMLQPIIQELQNKYPSDLWEIVKYQ